MSIVRVATNLGTAWHAVNTAVLEVGYELLINDPARFDGTSVIGVDEHVWSHTGRSKYVIPVIDFIPIRDDNGPSRPALKVLLAFRDHMSTERTATINALTALLRVVDLGIEARRPLTQAQIDAISAQRARDEVPATATARGEATRLAKRVAARQGAQGHHQAHHRPRSPEPR